MDRSAKFYALEDFFVLSRGRGRVSRLNGRKYIFNCLCNGRVRMTIQLRNETARRDEITNFIESR